MVKLYGFGATRSLRVLWAMQELDAEFEFVPVNLRAGEHLLPQFLQLNPAGKIPVLVDGEMVLTESAAIVLYLAEKYPNKGLLPIDLAQRAQVYRWVLFAMTELESALWRMSRHSFLYPIEKRSPADIALAREDFMTMAKVLEQHMIGRRFIVGDTFTTADCVAAYIVDWAADKRMLDDLPELSAYIFRLRQRANAPPDFAEARVRLEVTAGALASSDT
jgi:glutathione S-transferase